MNAGDNGAKEERAAALLDELAGIRGELMKRLREAKRKKAAYEAAQKDLKIRYFFYVTTIREYQDLMEEAGKPVPAQSFGVSRPDRRELPRAVRLEDEQAMQEILGSIVNPAYFPESGIVYSPGELALSDKRDCWAVPKKKK